MGYFSELAIERRNVVDLGKAAVDDDDLEAIAAKLGGEVEGRFVCCPSPGCDDDDRSMYVRVDALNHIYIYHCEGPSGRAYAYVRKKLGLLEPTRKDHSQTIRRILSETEPAKGTLAEVYLRCRCITVLPPPALRFHQRQWHSITRSHHPVMVAERRNAAGNLVAIHRTYLRIDGRGKANVEPVRMDLGPAQGTAIRLSPVNDELLIGEGIETTLSAMMSTGRPGWAAGGLLRYVQLPKEVRSITICADGDDPGEQAARAAAGRWAREGREVKIARAPRDLDFNDVLMGKAP